MSRPLKFQSVEELEEKIQSYFEDCKQEGRPYTISGLAYYLGTSRKILLEYEARDDEFRNTIKKAKARIEAFVEESLWTPKVATGVIFNLKNNFGWVDKQELDQSSKVDATITVKMDGELEEWSK